MKLLEGETLAARIERGPLPLAEAMGIALGLLAALRVLHRQELGHRDFQTLEHVSDREWGQDHRFRAGAPVAC